MPIAMAREPNPLKTELITLSLNTRTMWYLDRLVETGLYGNNRTEAARNALYDHCKILVSNSTIPAIPALQSRDVTAFDDNVSASRL